MGPLSTLLGLILTRTMLVGAVLVMLWTLWNGLYMFAAGLFLALAYFLYISWRPVKVTAHLTRPPE
ncbi:MAG: hypothetical protein SVG88_05095 [Halobacteriales archaeon]|nr:hypothetical protein [Halobacteriales archaeon]